VVLFGRKQFGKTRNAGVERIADRVDDFCVRQRRPKLHGIALGDCGD
jgi:hypothetical protein